jgi:hypothetical protein
MQIEIDKRALARRLRRGKAMEPLMDGALVASRPLPRVSNLLHEKPNH